MGGSDRFCRVENQTAGGEADARRAESGPAANDLASLTATRNAAEAGIVTAIAEAQVSGSWQGAGVVSLNHWVCWQLGATPARAARYVAMAKRRDELPVTFELFAAGALGVDQVALICRHCPPESDAPVANFAVRATLPQLSRCLRDYQREPAGAEATATPVEHRTSLRFDDHGRFELRMSGDIEEGQRVERAVEQFRARLRAESESDDPVTRHVAFMALIDSAADADPSTSRRHRHRTLCHLELDDAGAWAGRAHLGPALDADLVRLVTCESLIQTVIERGGRPVALGRSRRVVPAWLRDLVLHRDEGCRFPGCTTTVNLDVHHLVHWLEGGTTDPDNLVTLCARHHTLHHRGEYRLRGDPGVLAGPDQPDGLVFTDPCGRTIRNPTPSVARDPSPELAPYRHPLGERLDTKHFDPAAWSCGQRPRRAPPSPARPVAPTATT